VTLTEFNAPQNRDSQSVERAGAVGATPNVGVTWHVIAAALYLNCVTVTIIHESFRRIAAMVRLLCLTAALLTAAVAVGQDSPLAIRLDVQLVTLDVGVFDADGRPVSDLTREDFLAYEDGVPQEIRNFSPADAPYSIQLLIDRSVSMQDHWPLMEPALARLVSNLKPQDRISIGAFDERSKDVEVLLDWRDVGNGASMQILINPVGRGNMSVHVSMTAASPGTSGTISYPSKDFYRALDWVAGRLSGISGRKGAIVFSDGRPRGISGRVSSVDGSRIFQLDDARDDGDFRKVMRTIEASKARFDFVAVNTDLNPAGGVVRGPLLEMLGQGLPTRSKLELLAAASGGRVVFPRRVEDTAMFYERIARELGTSYTLAYSPASVSKAGSYHRIEIRTRRTGLKVQQSRDGYSGR